MKLIKTANKHSIKITKTEWEKIGNKQGWLKKAEDNKDNKKYEVIDNDFNRENYSDLIGKVFDTPPAYVQVKVIKNIQVKLIEAISK